MNQLKIVIIGGWAQSAASYAPLAHELRQLLFPGSDDTGTSNDCIHILPLKSNASVLYSQLTALASVFRDTAARVLWLGCSLGGLHLLRWLQQRSVEEADLRPADECVVLFGTNPRFCEASEANWPGMPVTTLDMMLADLSRDQPRTVRAFNILQCRLLPSTRRRQALKMLNASPCTAPPTVLEQGLRLLKDNDLRTVSTSTPLPLLALFGALDPLTGVSVAKAFGQLADEVSERQWPRPVVKLLSDAGHYPDELGSGMIAEHCEDFLRVLTLRNEGEANG